MRATASVSTPEPDSTSSARERPPAVTAMSDLEDHLDKTLPAILDLLRGSDVRELEVQEGDFHVRLHRAVAESARWSEYAGETSQDSSAPEQELVRITSPLVGTFYRAGKPGMPPLASEGTRVEEDTIVGIVEALQVLTEVAAGVSGAVTEVLATDGQPVEYGQTLFEVQIGG